MDGGSTLHVIGEQIVGLLELRLERLPVWSLVFATCYLLFFLIKFFSTRFRSYFKCCVYFYEGVGAYFAASTLMSTGGFLDTAAVYALFRVSRDCCHGNNEEEDGDGKKLETFEKNFWTCLKKGSGSYSLHPIPPAVIETVKRRNYSEKLLHQFFRSISNKDGKDAGSPEDENYYYMEGCAAVMGEFMLPILEPDEKLFQDLIPHARQIGRVFQMTNILRVITEDWEQGLKYIPEDLRSRHNVSLTTKDPTQPGFIPMIEEMFQHTDKLFASAESALAKLVPDVCHILRVTRHMYEDMHAKLRDNNYEVFRGNLEVKFNISKIRIAANEIPTLQLLRISTIECIAWIIGNASWIALIAWACFTTSCHMDAPSYFQFHLINTLPVLLWVFPPKHVQLDICILGLMAFTYTVPWDNMLVWGNGWSYPPERVLAVIGWVPIEEYSFFVIETFIVCGTFMHMAGEKTRFEPRPWSVSRWRIFGAGVIAVCLSGLVFTRHFYFGSLLVWCMLCIAFQWWFSVEVIAVHTWLIVKCVAVSWLYLCIIDHWGMAKGIWTIEDTMFDFYPGLPVEEAMFFFVTSVMCCQGFVLILSYMKMYFPGVKKFVDSIDPNVFRFVNRSVKSDTSASEQ